MLKPMGKTGRGDTIAKRVDLARWHMQWKYGLLESQIEERRKAAVEQPAQTQTSGISWKFIAIVFAIGFATVVIGGLMIAQGGR